MKLLRLLLTLGLMIATVIVMFSGLFDPEGSQDTAWLLGWTIPGTIGIGLFIWDYVDHRRTGHGPWLFREK